MFNPNFLFCCLSSSVVVGTSAISYHYAHKDDVELRNKRSDVAASALNNQELSELMFAKEEQNKMFDEKNTLLATFNAETKTLTIQKSLLLKAKEMNATDISELTKALTKAKRDYEEQVSKEKEIEDKVTEKTKEREAAKKTYEDANTALLNQAKEAKTQADNDLQTKTIAKNNASNAYQANQTALTANVAKWTSATKELLVSLLKGLAASIFSSTDEETTKTVKELIEQLFKLPGEYKTEAEKTKGLKTSCESAESAFNQAQTAADVANTKVSTTENEIKNHTTSNNAQKAAYEALVTAVSTVETSLKEAKTKTTELITNKEKVEKAFSEKEATTDDLKNILENLNKLKAAKESINPTPDLPGEQAALTTLITSITTATTSRETDSLNTYSSLMASTEAKINKNIEVNKQITKDIQQLKDSLLRINKQIGVIGTETTNLVSFHTSST